MPKTSSGTRLLDSGATHHMSCIKESFSFLSDSPVASVMTATGEEARVIGQGSVELLGIEGVKVTLQNVLYVPSFKTSLLSVSSVFDSGGYI